MLSIFIKELTVNIFFNKRLPSCVIYLLHLHMYLGTNVLYDTTNPFPSYYNSRA